MTARRVVMAKEAEKCTEERHILFLKFLNERQKKKKTLHEIIIVPNFKVGNLKLRKSL